MRFVDALKSLTVVAAIGCFAAAPPAAQAQSFNINIGNGGSNVNSNLPPTNLDSFVYQAGGAADMIYGDESTGLPPLYGFTQASRINTGITGVNAAGLTTGHGSYMPCAWGADEFLSSPGEWCNSGNGSGETMGAAALDAADLLEQSIGLGTDLFTLGLQAMNSSAGGLSLGISAGMNGLSGGVSALGGLAGVGVNIGSGGVDISGGAGIGDLGGGFSTGFGF